MQKAIMTFVGSTALMVSLGALNAAAQQRVQAGVLTCRLGPSVGRIISARPRMRCQFVKSDGRTENYLGTVTRFRTGSRHHCRRRHEVGGSGEHRSHRPRCSGWPLRRSQRRHLTGVGIGANALIGGSRRSTVLQPVSVAGSVGINLAVGVAGLALRYSGG